MSARRRQTRRPTRLSSKTANWLHLEWLRPIDDGRFEDGAFIIQCAVPDDRKILPDKACCLAPWLKMNGTTTIRMRHRRMQPMPTWLEIKKQRFECLTCKASCYEVIPEIEGSRRMTQAFEHEVFMSAIKRPFEDAAVFHQLTKATTQRIFLERGRERLKEYEIVLPRVLGVDENRILGGDRFICMDIENGKILDLLPSRDGVDLRAYFMDMPYPWHVEVFVQDMWNGYRTIKQEFFPKAFNVVDKFHVVRYANDAFDEARKEVQKHLSNEDRIWLKGKRKLFLKRWDTLPNKGQDLVAEITARDELLSAAYVAKEKFYDLYDLSDRKTAEEAFEEWDRTLAKPIARFFRPVARMVRRWHEETFNWYEARYTNGRLERRNRDLNEINRRGFGYNFETFRLKVLLRYGNIIPLGDLAAFNIGGSEEEVERVLNFPVIHGFDPATVARSIGRGRF